MIQFLLISLLHISPGSFQCFFCRFCYLFQLRENKGFSSLNELNAFSLWEKWIECNTFSDSRRHFSSRWFIAFVAFRKAWDVFADSCWFWSYSWCVNCNGKQCQLESSKMIGKWSSALLPTGFTSARHLDALERSSKSLIALLLS